MTWGHDSSTVNTHDSSCRHSARACAAAYCRLGLVASARAPGQHTNTYTIQQPTAVSTNISRSPAHTLTHIVLVQKRPSFPHAPSPGYSGGQQHTHKPSSRQSYTLHAKSPQAHSPFPRKHQLNRLDFKPAERKPDRHRLPRRLLLSALALTLQRKRLQPRIVL